MCVFHACRCINLPIIGQQCLGSASSNPLYSICEHLADTYYEAVARLGQEPFDRDQSDARTHLEACEVAALHERLDP